MDVLLQLPDLDARGGAYDVGLPLTVVGAIGDLSFGETSSLQNNCH